VIAGLERAPVVGAVVIVVDGHGRRDGHEAQALPGALVVEHAGRRAVREDEVARAHDGVVALEAARHEQGLRRECSGRGEHGRATVGSEA